MIEITVALLPRADSDMLAPAQTIAEREASRAASSFRVCACVVDGQSNVLPPGLLQAAGLGASDLAHRLARRLRDD